MMFLLPKVVSSSSSRIFCRQFWSICQWTPFQQFGQRRPLPCPVPSDAIATHELKRLGARANHSFQITDWLSQEKDERYKSIESSLWPGSFKDDAPWGFMLYRTSYVNEEAWQQMVREIQATVKPDPELPRRDIVDRVLARHDLRIMDDRAQFDGATSHELRDHFVSWVIDELPKRLHAYELERIDWDAMRRNEGYDEEHPCAVPPDVRSGLYGARYDFCLFVDNICLESLDHMDPPVVKMLKRDWGHLAPEKRGYTVYPGYEDGCTEEDSEEVGWMYIDVLSYMDFYARFSKDHTYWYDEYSRPPGMIFRDETPGFWRK